MYIYIYHSCGARTSQRDQCQRAHVAALPLKASHIAVAP